MSATEPDPPTGPYARAATTYWQAGWKGILPVPPRTKKLRVVGYTGNHGTDPSYPDIQAWTDGPEGDGNLALRLPPNVIGIDVDAYDAKPGGLVFAALEKQHGPLPPTWRTTSRGDGTSGIRLYQIPVGLRWPGVLGPGIETVRHGHRYAIAWPSVHPNGRVYRWIGPDGATTLEHIPTPTDLPHLPDQWVTALTRGELAHPEKSANLTDQAATAWLTERNRDAIVPCGRLTKAITEGTTPTGGSRHDQYLALTNRIIWLAGEGHTGITHALAAARDGFLLATAGDRHPDEAASEWDRLVTGAVCLAAGAHPNPVTTDPCTDPFAGLIQRQDQPCPPASPRSPNNPSSASPTASTGSQLHSNEHTPNPLTAPPATTAEQSTDRTDPPPAPPAGTNDDPYAALRARFVPGGTFIHDIPDNVPAIWGAGEQVLWASGEALTICGPAGVGKTTLAGQIVRARLIGGTVLDLPIEPTTTRVLYLAMDRPRQIARALRRVLHDIDRHTLDDTLSIWPGPPIADVAAHPETLLGLVQLADADTVVIDSIKDAAIGLSNDEVGAGYNRARQMCIAAGIEVLELHHMVKKGENGARPNSLADLYGSVWIGAGAGSVLNLHGTAGDPIVEMTHLKTPAEEVGPYRVIHDHTAGTTNIWHETDLVHMAKVAGPLGITARTVASNIGEKENPTPSEVEKARRRLNKLVDAGLLYYEDGGRGGSGDARKPSVWVWIDTDITSLAAVDKPVDNLGKVNHEVNHAPDFDEPNHGPTFQSRSGQNRRSDNHDVNHANHGEVNHASTPVPRRGGARSSEAKEQTQATCEHCGADITNGLPRSAQRGYRCYHCDHLADGTERSS